MAPSGGAQSNTIRVMGITPEKHMLHSEVLSGLHSQFHSQASQSPQSLETTAIRAPGSLGPLPLSSPSSLSRTQFLVAAQAATLPCFPSSSSSDGGVVLDRVLVQGGKGEHLWAALTGRAKAQRITAKRRQHGWKRALADPENYVLCANARLRARPGSCVKLSAELQPRSASEIDEPHQQEPQALGESIAGVLRRSTVRASSQLQHRLGHAELRAGVAYNQRLQRCKGYSTVPLTSSIDLCTPHQLSTPLQFRAGLYHATAPAEPTTEEGSPCPLRSSVHAQGGLALQGERNLWSGNPAARRIKLYKQQQQRQQQQQQQQRRPHGTSGSAPILASSHPISISHSPAESLTASAASPPLASHSSSVGATAHTGAAGGSSSSNREGARPRSNTLGPHNPIRQYLQRLLPQGHHAGSGFGEEEEEEQQQQQQRWRGHGEWGSSSRASSGWLAPDADQVQESVIDATQSTSRLREDVQSLTEWVTSGAFSEQLQRRVGPSAPSKGKAPRFESHPSRIGSSASSSSSSSSENQPPWSSLLGPPHFRIAGMFGACMLAPLGPSHGSRSGTSRNASSGASGEGGSAASTSHQPLQPSLESLRGSISHLAKQEVAVRPFATAGASLQLGWFQRPALDYTRLVAKLDLGVPGSAQHAAGLSNLHPAFGLEQRGVWHALTLSLRQQLMGPLRFCADLRYSLDSKHPWSSAPAFAPPPPPPSSTGPIPLPGKQSIDSRRGNRASEGAGSLARHIGGMRPSLLESTYGLDLVLPGMSGFGRLVAWYAPGRKEGMLELRLF